MYQCGVYREFDTLIDMKWLFVALLLLVSVGVHAADRGEMSRTRVYESGMEGYVAFRIPAIVRTKSGALLAFAEARKASRSDAGNIDLVLRRSEDGGSTWGDMIVVWNDGDNTCGNPAPVVDSRSGRVVLLMTWNKGTDKERDIMSRTSQESRRVYICHSDDEGLSWSKPQDITSSVKRPDWTWYATGPCHALQMCHKSYRGRLVVPCNHAVYHGEDSDYNSHLIMSDDGGESWYIGGLMLGGNESTVAELKDGTLMYNARWQRGEARYARHYAISRDGGKSLGEVVRDTTLVEPVCQGSIIGYSPNGRATDELLFCNPASTKRRENLTLRYSRDGGESWCKSVVVVGGHAAYSDLVVLRSGDVGVLCESGDKSPYERIEFVVVPKRMLK